MVGIYLSTYYGQAYNTLNALALKSLLYIVEKILFSFYREET